MATPRDTINAAIAMFSEQLRDLRNNAPTNAPTLQQIVDNSHLPRSTAYAALTGKRLPSADTLRTLVTAWGGDLEWWLQQRQLIAQAQRELTRESRYYQHMNNDDNDTTLQHLAQHISQYLQHLPTCGLGDHTPHPTKPGVATSRPVEGCTCGLAKAMPLWYSTIWDDEPPWDDENDHPQGLPSTP